MTETASSRIIGPLVNMKPKEKHMHIINCIYFVAPCKCGNSRDEQLLRPLQRTTTPSQPSPRLFPKLRDTGTTVAGTDGKTCTLELTLCTYGRLTTKSKHSCRLFCTAGLNQNTNIVQALHTYACTMCPTHKTDAPTIVRTLQQRQVKPRRKRVLGCVY